MIDPSGKLVCQGILHIDLTSSSQFPTKSKSFKKKSANLLKASYSVLYLDGHLDCYPGDPFSVGSKYEGSKPIQVLYLTPLNGWGKITINTITTSNNNSAMFPFSIRRNPLAATSPPPLPSQPRTPNRAAANLTHLGLDVEAMGPSCLPNHSPTPSRDRKTIKQLLGFRAKRSRSLASVRGAANPPPELTLKPPPLPNQASRKNSDDARSALSSDNATVSSGHGLYPENMPDCLFFNTDTEVSRRQWTRAFSTVFRQDANHSLKSGESTDQLEVPSRPHSVRTAPSMNSVSPSKYSFQQASFVQPSPLSQLQQKVSSLPLQPAATTTTTLDHSLSVSSLRDLPHAIHTGDSATERTTPSNLSPPPPPISVPQPSAIHQVTEPRPSLGTSRPSSPAGNIPSKTTLASPFPERAEDPMAPKSNGGTVPAWIMAVRNADVRSSEGAASPLKVSTSASGESSITSSRATQHTISSAPMSHSYSAPVALNPINEKRSFSASSGGHKPTPFANPLRSLSNSVASSLKRAGSLTDRNEPLISPGSHHHSSTLPLTREDDAASFTSESGFAGSPPLGGQSDASANPETNEVSNLKDRRLWFLQSANKKRVGSASVDRASASTSSSPQTHHQSISRSTSASNRQGRHGLYNLRGPSTSSVGASSRDSDGQHSIYRPFAAGSEVGETPDSLGLDYSSHPTDSTSVTGHSKQSFCDWLSSTSSQAVLRMELSTSPSIPSSPPRLCPLRSQPLSSTSNYASFRSTENGLTDFHGRFSSESSSSARAEYSRVSESSPVTTPSEEVSPLTPAHPHTELFRSSSREGHNSCHIIEPIELISRFQPETVDDCPSLSPSLGAGNIPQQQIKGPAVECGIQSENYLERIVERPAIVHRRTKTQYHLRSFDLNTTNVPITSLPAPPGRRRPRQSSLTGAKSRPVVTSPTGISFETPSGLSNCDPDQRMTHRNQSGNQGMKSLAGSKSSTALSSVMEGEFGSEGDKLARLAELLNAETHLEGWMGDSHNQQTEVHTARVEPYLRVSHPMVNILESMDDGQRRGSQSTLKGSREN